MNHLIEALAANTFEEKYPNLHYNDGKTHILYLSPSYDATGYYRMMMPALELASSTSHAAIVSDVRTVDFNKAFEHYDIPVDERLVRWADHVVVPPITTSVAPIIEGFRAINPFIRFTMDVDRLHTAYPKEDPAKLNDDDISQFLKNLLKVDRVIAATVPIAKHSEYLLDQQFSNVEVAFEQFPTLLSTKTYQSISTIKRNTKNKIRIGIIGNTGNAYNLVLLNEVLPKLDHDFTLVLFGFSKEVVDRFEGIEVVHEKAVGIKDYFGKLNRLCLDLVLIPQEKHIYNLSCSGIHFLESAAFGIPCIATALPPFTQMIKHNENGLLAKNKDDWLAYITKMMTDQKFRLAIGQQAFRDAWRYWSFNKQYRQGLERLFP